MKYSIVLAAIALGGCTTTKIVKETELVGVAIYPNLPNMEAPEGFDWVYFKFDVPRDMSAAPVVKATPECKAVAASKRDQMFWATCGEQPPLKDSNIIVGFDVDNLEIFRGNLSASAAKEEAWLERLDSVNEQREGWRDLNEKTIAETGVAPPADNSVANEEE